MVEVFKTNVQERNEATKIIQTLLEHFPNHIINFDLEDCDNILRIENPTIDLTEIENKLYELNCRFELLK